MKPRSECNKPYFRLNSQLKQLTEYTIFPNLTAMTEKTAFKSVAQKTIKGNIVLIVIASEASEYSVARDLKINAELVCSRCELKIN